MSPTGGDAGPVGAAFTSYLFQHVKPRRLGRVYSAESGFIIFPGRELLRAPDVAFVRADRVPHGIRGFPQLAPDLVVEVISPTDVKIAVMTKADMWLDAGVRLVWVADPDDQTITVLGPDRTSRLLRQGDVLDGGEVLPEFRVPVLDFFV
jgi:Uma2 family endonuclease